MAIEMADIVAIILLVLSNVLLWATVIIVARDIRRHRHLTRRF